MFVKIKDTYINRDHVSLVSLRNHVSLVSLRNEGKTLVVDLAYSKAEEPVFVTYHYDTEEEALSDLHALTND
jgi:hypothetical protein